eukprot:scaffold178387_cov17-Tisochrysis_lutea.AAC.1
MTRMAAIAAEQPAEAKVQTHADLRHNKGLDEALQCVIHSCTIEHGRSGPKFKQAPHASQQAAATRMAAAEAAHKRAMEAAHSNWQQ